MGHRPKVKPKRKKPKNTDKEQSERFIETARKLGIEEDRSQFEQAMKVVVPAKKRGR